MHRELGGTSFAELGLPEGLGRDAELDALLDATRIEAQASTRRLDSEQGPTDPDARFGRDVYGYQMHISSDFATGLICNAALTPGNVTETEVADALLLGGERFVPADRAYDTRERRALYDEREIEYLILQRRNKHHPLSEAERPSAHPHSSPVPTLRTPRRAPAGAPTTANAAAAKVARKSAGRGEG